jgi:OmpA-OmpF porin, OOP family
MKVICAFVFVIGIALQSAAQTPDALQLVNSSYDEQSPVVSPDGKTLYITISRHAQNIGGKHDPGDIWVSTLIGDQWSAPVHAGPILNDRGYNAVAGISADGSQLFLLSHYDPAGGTVKSQGLSVSKSTGAGWSKPENKAIPYFQNKSTQTTGYVSPDQGVFVYSAETYGSRGVEDIFVSFNEDGRWTAPKNLGPTINSQFQELSPTLSADGKTLYFSANGRGDVPGFDVYYSVRLDDSWTKWSQPVSIGSRVNTPSRELYYRPFPDLGYALYTTTSNSDGNGQLRMIVADIQKDTIKKVIPKIDSVPRVVQVRRDTVKSAEKIVTIYGKVNNSKTHEPIKATLTFSSPKYAKSVSSLDANGFSVQIPSVNVYTIRIEAQGYISAFEKLDIHTYEMNELEMSFTLQPVEVGTTVNLRSVLFERGTANLIPESTDELDLVVNFLQMNPRVVIDLAGHTDNRGVHSHNVRLSQQRVNKVKEYLVSKGIGAKRISGRGYGGTKPIASNDTEESRMLNRRVEFTIKKL